MQPTVTVSIPTCCNRAHLLKDAIEGVLNQSIRNIEIFVSNDGSTDETRTLLASYDDERFQYFDLPPPGGLHANLNHCLRLGSAPLVAICQDDDVWLPHNLERLVDAMGSNPQAVLAHGAFRLIDATGGTLTRWSAWGDYDDDIVETGDQFIMRSMRAINGVNMSSAIIRRGTIGDSSFREADDVLCDTGFWMRLARHGSVVFVGEPLTALRVHPSTISVDTKTNEPEDRGRTLRQIALAQSAKSRFLREYGYTGRELRRHRKLSRHWVRSDLLRLVTEKTSPERRLIPTAVLLAKAIYVEPTLVATPRTLRVLLASLVGSRFRSRIRRRRSTGLPGRSPR